MARCLLTALVLATFLLLTGCNRPPLYESRAEKDLAKRGVEAELIERLTKRQPLTAAEADRLSQFDSIPALHLLANNPSISAELMQKLAGHESFEVHTGLVSNHSTPAELALQFRSVGAYSTVNTMIARNPNVPAEVLREMYHNGEAMRASFGMNPNCPEDLMWDILRNGNEIDRAWLANNRFLPDEIIAELEVDMDETVQRYLRSNPRYREFVEQRSRDRMQQQIDADEQQDD